MKPMSRERFRQLVASFGSRLERWPESERALARELLEVSEEARELVQHAALLDTHFDAYELPPLAGSLERRIQEIPIRARGARRPRLRALWAPALAWAVAAACGIWLGSTLPGEGAPQLGQETAASELEESALASSLSEESALEIASGAFADLEGLP
jgi:hypothetical protein